MTDHSNKDAALASADNDASAALSAEMDAWIDLSRAGTDSEILMAHLTERFAEVNESFIGAISSDPQALTTALRALSRQLARVQADVFVLKSAVLGRNKMVLTQDWDYRDPLAAHAAAFTADGQRSMWSEGGLYTLPLDDSLMGFGWFAAEKNERSVWRWSGPGVTATVLIPIFFEGRIAVSVTFDSLRRGVLPDTGGLFVNGKPVDYEMTFADHKTTEGCIEFILDLANESRLPTDGPTSFLPLEFRLTRTYSPKAEFGKSDSRELGICLRNISFSVV